MPDDVQAMAPLVLSHRVKLSAQSRLRPRGEDDIVREIVQRVPVPVDVA